MKNLIVFKQVFPSPHVGNVYRVIEKVDTIDGSRDRITHATFPTIEETLEFVANWNNTDARVS